MIMIITKIIIMIIIIIIIIKIIIIIIMSVGARQLLYSPATSLTWNLKSYFAIFS